jgi:hypothetical protein
MGRLERADAGPARAALARRRAAPSAKGGPSTTISSTSAAASAANAAAPGAAICLADGTYGKLSRYDARGLRAGSHKVTVRAYDTAGQLATDSVAVRVKSKARAHSAASSRSRSA